MLLTITNNHSPPTDLGYLLHKNPSKVQSFELAFGRVHDFYTEATLDRCQSQERGIRWWEELTGRGGEGMVVKPLAFIEKGRQGLVQPAVKCRGREYLRIIYGPEYAMSENLERLRSRGLSAKRSFALR
jgi:hypothetical protein